MDTALTDLLEDASGALRYDSHDAYPPALGEMAATLGLEADPVALGIAYAGCEITTASAAYLCGEVLLGLVAPGGGDLGALVWESLVGPIPPTLGELGCDHAFDPASWPEAHRGFTGAVARGLGLDPGLGIEELVDAVSERLAAMAERVARDLGDSH